MPKGDPALGVLQLLCAEDGQSLPRVAKRLGLAQSELLRLLSELGDDGMGLVQLRADGERRRLWLSAKGRGLCAS